MRYYSLYRSNMHDCINALDVVDTCYYCKKEDLDLLDFMDFKSCEPCMNKTTRTAEAQLESMEPRRSGGSTSQDDHKHLKPKGKSQDDDDEGKSQDDDDNISLTSIQDELFDQNARKAEKEVIKFEVERAYRTIKGLEHFREKESSTTSDDDDDDCSSKDGTPSEDDRKGTILGAAPASEHRGATASDAVPAYGDRWSTASDAALASEHRGVTASDAVPALEHLFDFFRYQLDPADSFYQYARPGCLYTS